MKFKYQRQAKKKSQSKNALLLKQKIAKAVSEGSADYALALKKRLRRRYAV